MNWRHELDQAIERRVPRMIELRRHLHTFPELSLQERETSLRLYQMLGDDGLNVRMGPEGRGVIADIASENESAPIVALRADIDALRIHDQKQTSYRSRHEGVMHACGHDAHTAMAWGAITALNDLAKANQLPEDANFRAIFQPAEEVCCGAKEMIGVGALDGVSAIFAAHVDPTRQVGKIGLRKGVLTANCDEMEIRISGKGGHAARPHETADPIAAAAQLINSVYLTVPRATDSQESVVVTIGQIYGGENANVIPEEVLLRGTIRTLDQNVRRSTIDHMHRIAAGVGRITNTEITVTFGLASASVTNDFHLIDLFRRSVSDVVSEDGIEKIARASMGSEDFSFYLEHVPGAMMRLGCTSPQAGGSALHTPTFDIDEAALTIGARVLARCAIYWFLAKAADTGSAI